MNYRLKLLVFALSALVVLVVLDVGYSALNVISRLSAVEAERDQWQRPIEILQALGVRPGEVVVDLGCGSGYFTLKLSSAVGRDGRVMAEDIRRLPLVFLWYRAVSKGERNVRIVLGDPTDPHLPMRANAVLILNTYHEFVDARSMLAHVSQSLVAGGRLVVVDRSPNAMAMDDARRSSHEVSAERVEAELREEYFEIIRREDQFIDKDPENEAWWLIVARKP